jgi:PadR family transcriptional regulator PadR
LVLNTHPGDALPTDILLRSGYMFYNLIHMSDRVTGLELAALVTVARLADEAYGAAVRREMCAVDRRDYSVGAIYTTLQRLENKGLLRSWASEPLPERGGRSRRHFALTRAGAAACRAAQSRSERMWRGLTLQSKPT